MNEYQACQAHNISECVACQPKKKDKEEPAFPSNWIHDKFTGLTKREYIAIHATDRDVDAAWRLMSSDKGAEFTASRWDVRMFWADRMLAASKQK